jgi:hypothetical protein
MKKHSLALLLLLTVSINAFCQFADITQKVVANRKNSAEQQKKPYVILISADGFRYDFAKALQGRKFVKAGQRGCKRIIHDPFLPIGYLSKSLRYYEWLVSIPLGFGKQYIL